MPDHASLPEVATLASLLPPAERRQLAEAILRELREAVPPAPRRSGHEVRGSVPYPLCGEEAQAWVSRSRRDSDEERQRQSREAIEGIAHELPQFQLQASVDDKTGRMVAVYLRVRVGHVTTTKEVEPGVAYADYDAQGTLLGIELFGPCQVAVLDSIARGEPEPVQRFLHGGVPRELVPA